MSCIVSVRQGDLFIYEDIILIPSNTTPFILLCLGRDSEFIQGRNEQKLIQQLSESLRAFKQAH